MNLALKFSQWQTSLKLWRQRMAWFHRGSAEEDKIVSDVAKTLLDGVSDADQVRTIEAKHGRNLRDQLTVEEAEEMYKEGRLRGFGFQRN